LVSAIQIIVVGFFSWASVASGPFNVRCLIAARRFGRKGRVELSSKELKFVKVISRYRTTSSTQRLLEMLSRYLRHRVKFLGFSSFFNKSFHP
jgi:hypothetical protein